MPWDLACSTAAPFVTKTTPQADAVPTALREMALSVVADSTDDRAEDDIPACDARPVPGQRPDRGLITPDPDGDLVRRGIRRARRLTAESDGVYGHDPRRGLSVREAKVLTTHFGWERFEAEVVELRRRDVANTLPDFAREHHITEIIMGKSRRSRLEKWRRGSAITSVVRDAGTIDVLVVAPPEANGAARGR